ncbi:uncharacterized protein N7483_003770 [Penicillium malachiteum]|uniref:uncharacterized protein n=1 Tax=Penicillium malachiteum TaxID=1324776 RepID=UPI002546E419|nr:uncharacterized protein N7483_003770 [Penicillium malachiteum]KAJ5729262.1 hypothetical protein N7483_003770 [Penicillium malachiteum]
MSDTHKPMRSGSSTGAPGVPTFLQDQRNQYDPATTRFNSSTGAGYKTGGSKSQEPSHRPITPTKGFDAPAGDDRINHAPSTAERVQMEKEMEKSQKAFRSNRASEDIGKGINGVAAKIHGAGETLRGALNATVDRAFGSHESAEWNEEISRRGEQEFKSKEFGEDLPSQRE